MAWNDYGHQWPEIADRIATVFPETDRVELSDMGPDRDSVLSHIAMRHDLTPTEARQTLEERVLIAAPATTYMAAE